MRPFLRYSTFIFGILFLCVTFSCSKKRDNRHKFAGVYAVEKYERTYYKNGAVDSVSTIENYGHLCFYENPGDINDVYSTMPAPLDAWNYNGVTIAETIWWTTNDHHNLETITFWCEDDYTAHFATYTMDKYSKHKQMKWYYAFTNAASEITYIETLYVRKQ